MDTLIVYIDESAHALKLLTPMLSPDTARAPMRWVLVACTPRVTRHASKFVTSNARQSWRSKWADKAFEQIVPLLQSNGDAVVTQIAQGPLCEFTDNLLARHAGSRVLDARRPKFGEDLQPVTRQQPQAPEGVWGCAAALAGVGMLVTAD
jgi:hypothetical protein